MIYRLITQAFWGLKSTKKYGYYDNDDSYTYYKVKGTCVQYYYNFESDLSIHDSKTYVYIKGKSYGPFDTALVSDGFVIISNPTPIVYEVEDESSADRILSEYMCNSLGFTYDYYQTYYNV